MAAGRRIATTAGVIGLCAWAGLQAQARAADARQQVLDYLARLGFTSAEASQLDAGQVVARSYVGQVDTELLTVAAVRIDVPRDDVLSYYGRMISYVDGQVTLAFGRFSTPPALADVKDLTLDPADLQALRECRAGTCDLRIGGARIDDLRARIDWAAPDHADRANALVREAAVRYVTDYMQRGDAALLTYDARGRAVSLADQWRSILANSPYFQQYAPPLEAYLRQYPSARPAGATDVIYWVKEQYGRKPVISVVHGVIYVPPEATDRVTVVQKQIYASHYYEGSLAVATITETATAQGRASYLVYGNRSRGDLLRGGFGGLKRRAATDQARRAALQTLGTIKRVLEQSAAAAR